VSAEAARAARKTRDGEPVARVDPGQPGAWRGVGESAAVSGGVFAPGAPAPGIPAPGRACVSPGPLVLEAVRSTRAEESGGANATRRSPMSFAIPVTISGELEPLPVLREVFLEHTVHVDHPVAVLAGS